MVAKPLGRLSTDFRRAIDREVLDKTAMIGAGELSDKPLNKMNAAVPA